MSGRMDSGIISALQALAQTTKQAAEAPTTHPVGKADDGAQPASTGEFAATNESDAKNTAGTQGVDAATSTVNPVEKQKDTPAQAELAPGDVTSPAPAEIKPKTTVEHGDTDTNAGALGGQETGDGGEGRIEGVGGPKFASSQAILDEAEAFLKEASALVPDVQAPSAKVAAAAPAAVKTAGTVTAEEAAELEQAEKIARAQVEASLAEAGVAFDAPLAVKRAAIVKSMTEAAVKAASGYIVSLDTEVLGKILSGQKIAADDSSEVMPASTSTDDAGAGAGDPAAAAAGAADPAAAAAGDPAAAGGQSQEQLLQEILQAAAEGKISQEELMQLLQQLGIPPEAIQQLIAEASQGGAGGEAAPADAGAAAAGGEVNPVETSDVPAGGEDQTVA